MTYPRSHNEFPKFLVTEEIDNVVERTYLPLGQAAAKSNSYFTRVSIADEVLEADFTVRPITDEEKRSIVDLADEYDSMK